MTLALDTVITYGHLRSLMIATILAIVSKITKLLTCVEFTQGFHDTCNSVKDYI